MLGVATTLFLGFILPNSLELGSVLVGGQPVPAARVRLRQRTGEYEIIAVGSRFPAEFYAYCAAAETKRLDSLHVFITAHLIPETSGGQVSVVSGCWWYAPEAVRRVAPHHLMQFSKGDDRFRFVAEPFARIADFRQSFDED
ncbi:MAG: hypothetical protein N2117_12785 [Anaerolineales bacterium]|nr:hypothetical protein [Anaerolineales bacterium]